MKLTHVMLRGFNDQGKAIASCLVTPAGVCGSACGMLYSPDRYCYKNSGSFGYVLTDNSESEWKQRAKRQYGAVRFQRFLVDF